MRSRASTTPFVITTLIVTGLLVVVVAGGVATAASSSGSGSVVGADETTTLAPTPKTVPALQAAATAWAHAFLTGTAQEMRALQGPECRSTTRRTLPKAVLADYLRGLRASMRRALGRPLEQVHVEAVDVRNVSRDRGEAQAVYDLPITKVGNDNWVEFTLHHGRWLVSNCKAPILGNSTTATPR